MKYAKNENGTVKNYGDLKRLGDYKNYLTFWKQPIEVHNSEGFFEVVKPSITNYQRHIGLIPSDFANKKYTHRLYHFTQDEIDDYDQKQLDQDQSSQFFQNRKLDGEVLIDRFSAFIYRKHVEDNVPIGQIIVALEFFYDALTPLKWGYFELSIKRLNALQSPNQQITDLKTLIIANVTDKL